MSGVLCPESSGGALRWKHSVGAGVRAWVQPTGSDEQETRGVGEGKRHRKEPGLLTWNLGAPWAMSERQGPWGGDYEVFRARFL